MAHLLWSNPFFGSCSNRQGYDWGYLFTHFLTIPKTCKPKSQNRTEDLLVRAHTGLLEHHSATWLWCQRNAGKRVIEWNKDIHKRTPTPVSKISHPLFYHSPALPSSSQIPSVLPAQPVISSTWQNVHSIFVNLWLLPRVRMMFDLDRVRIHRARSEVGDVTLLQWKKEKEKTTQAVKATPHIN